MLVLSRAGLAAAAVATALAATPASAAVSTPAVIPPRTAASVIPARVGLSLAYRYDLDQSGPRGSTTTHASVAFTRVANERVTVTLTPAAGEPSAVVGRVATDGTLHLDALGGPSAADADLPQDTPLGGLADDQRGGTPGRAGAVPQSPSWSALAALLAFRATGGTTAPTWTFSAPVGPAGAGPVPLLALTARATTANGGSLETIVAEGRGEVQLAAGAGPRGTFGGRGSGGARRRGGSYPGGGSSSGQYPGGGSSGGQYPSGGGAAAAGQPVPATVALHVESVFRDGRLQSARGTQTSTVHAGGTDVTTTSRWTLAAY